MRLHREDASQRQIRTTPGRLGVRSGSLNRENIMAVISMKQLLEAGVHFGHQTRRWNPKMKPFIHGKRHKIHVINLEETIRGLYQATHFVRSLAATGGQIMFLGTKKQIRPVVEAEAGKCNMPSVTERWIGGTLTNFQTVKK